MRFLPLILVSVLIALLASELAAAATPSGTEIPSFEVEGYQQDFGSSAETAERNLAIQQRGAGLVNALATVQGKDYAGLWFDNEAGEFVVPLVDAEKQDLVHDVLVGTNVDANARIEPAQYTWEELEATQEHLDEEFKPFFKEGLVQTSLDPRANAVIVSLADGASKAQIEELDRSAQGASAKVEVRRVSAEHVKVANTSCQTEFRRCDSPLRGGVGLKKGGAWGPECTAAFKAVGKTFGNRFMLTAGHCIVLTGIQKWYAELLNNEYREVGLAQGVTYPGGDWAALNANGSYWDTNPWPSQVAFWDHGAAAQETAITAESASYIGQYVCHAGFTTGGHCGSVVKLNVTAEGSGGLQYHLAMHGPTCIDEGDSGGAVFAGNVALGIVSARVLPAQGCGADYGLYAEIAEVTDALAVTVGPRLGAPPYAETEEPTGVNGTGVTFNGIVNPHGIASNYHFQWGTTSAYGNATQLWGAGSGWQTIPVSGPYYSQLEPLTTYHYRIVAQNAAGTSYGVEEEVTTPSAPPIVVTEPATSVEQREVTLRGSVNPRGASTNYNFEYGPTTAYGTSVPIPSENVGEGRVAVAKSQLVKSLQPGETYHYRIKATNSFGETSYGADQQFTMKPAPPDVTTAPASTVTETSATLNGTVNPNGLETTYFFEYGPAESYGTKTPEVNMGTGTKFVAKNSALEGLAQSVTAFHYRVGATNSLGTTYGLDRTFNPGWKSQTVSPPAGAKGGSLPSVSCPAAGVCTAVGSYINSLGVTVTLAERWNGSSWTVQSTPNPAGAKGSVLKSVSCTSSTACTAVGYYVNSGGTNVPLAERWNGTSWSIQSTPSIEGAKESYFQSVSCTSATSCIAVGYYQNPSSYYSAVVASWNGTSWALQSAPSPEGSISAFLHAVSCTSATNCVAVGVQWGQFTESLPLAEHWNGTKWEVRATPNPEGSSFSFLQGLSCSSAAACTAVGGYYDKSETLVSHAVRWNGTSWTTQTTPSPEGAKGTELIGVSCPSAAVCLATGYFKDSSGTKVTLAERWNGTAWEAHTPQNPEGTKASQLMGISCIASTSCQTSGYWENSSGVKAALAQSYSRPLVPTAVTKPATSISQSGATLNGLANPNGATTKYFFEYGPTVSYGSKTAEVSVGSGMTAVAATAEISGLTSGNTYHYRTVATNSAGSSTGVDQEVKTTTPSWAIQTALSPEGAKGTVLKGVSCTSSTACTAVGYYVNSAGTLMALAERWNGTSWSIQSTPSIGGAKETTLSGVSCTSTTHCVAVGQYQDASSTYVALVMSWNGTNWTVQSAPSPAGSISTFLYRVSCTSTTNCVAVGTHWGQFTESLPLAEHWNGTKWEVRATPNPAGSSFTFLQGLSCSSAEACTAVGAYFDGSGTLRSLAERWNGTTWTIQTTPSPEGAKETEFIGVSCPSATTCLATGFFKNSSGTKVTLAERWNGTSWEVHSTPNPGGATEAFLKGISCTSSASCTAVGSFKNSSGVSVTLAEYWNGTKWEIGSTPNPEGAKGNSLPAVSCLAGSCEAVGSFQNAAGTTLPLAMGMK